MSETERELKRRLRGFMDRDVDELTVEELAMAERALKAARADAVEAGNETLERAAKKALYLLRRHRQRRVNERAVRDRRDGRRY